MSVQAAELQRREKNNRPMGERASQNSATIDREHCAEGDSGIPLFLQLPRQRQLAHKEEKEREQTIQPGVLIGKPGDRYEQEAEQVAAAVLRTSTLSAQGEPPRPYHQDFRRGNIKRAKNQLHAKSDVGRTPKSFKGNIPLHLRSSHGSPLADSTRERIEPILGMDLGHIRVHNDEVSRKQARAINAKAFAYGTDIWLGPGQRADDIGLMAHEATHVIQQRAGSFDHIQRDLCSSQIVGDTGEQQVSAEGGGSSRGDLSEEQRTERGRRQASAAPPGAQHSDIAEQIREREQRREEPDRIGPAPLRGIVVRAPNWRFFEGRDIPIVNWEATTGNVSFVSIPIPELLTEIEIGGGIRAFTHINAGYGPGQLRNIDLELNQRQSVLYQLGSFLGFRPDTVNEPLLHLFGDFRGQADIHIPARFDARFGLSGGLQAVAELLGIIDLASIHGRLEANATAQSTLAYNGRIYFTYQNGVFQFGFEQTLPLQINLGFGLDAVVGGSFGIWPVDYEWEKRWALACWRWRRLWQLNPSMTIAYNQSPGGGGASAFDSENAFVLNFEDIPVNDLISLVEELVEDNAPGELEQSPSAPCDDPLNIRWPYELPLPDGPRPLVRRGSGEYDDDSRGSTQRHMNNEINDRVELGLPLDDIACQNPMNDSEPIGAFDAHHRHPLAFGGQDQEFNLCALRRHLHETGHRKLRFQRDMVDTDSTWINCGVTQPDLYRHPAGQRYEIVGRK